MIWKIVKIILLLLVLLIAGGYAYVMLAMPKTAPPRAVSVDRSPERVARGKYIFDVVSSCAACHSVVDENRFAYPVAAGGYSKGKVFPGSTRSPLIAVNLTSDSQTGVGSMTDGQLIRAIREGIGRDGRPLFPGMPYTDFAHMSDADVESVVAYIRTIPPASSTLPKTQITFPMNLIMRLIPKPVGSVSAIPPSDRVAYGKYLTVIGNCKFCHTPFEKGQPVESKLFAGGHVFKVGPNARAVTANLTPEPNTGIGTMSEEEFLKKFYQYKDYAAKGSPVIKPELNTVMQWVAFSQMEPSDLQAIYAYLRTVPPVVNAVVTHPDSPEEEDSRKK